MWGNLFLIPFPLLLNLWRILGNEEGFKELFEFQVPNNKTPPQKTFPFRTRFYFKDEAWASLGLATPSP